MRFAEKNHKLVYAFLQEQRYDDDYYDLAVMGYLRAVERYLHASWRYEHLTEEYLMVIDVDIAVPACCIMNGGVPDV